jgi:type I restriction enzyme S subunit
MRPMKDSGVEWLGEVPEGWSLTRLGGVFRERRQQVNVDDFAPLSVTKAGIVPQLASAAKSDAKDKRKLVKNGDFVINSRSDRKGSSGLASTDGSTSLIYIVIEPKSISGKFSHHLLRCRAFQEEFFRWGTGIVDDLWSTRYTAMKMILLPIPPVAEQASISAYLDQETSRIDTLISKKEQLIEKLLERRQALITQVVTKGLDPNVPMKDSGVEWLGEVPEDWELKRVAHVSRRTKIPASGLGIVTAFRDGQVTLRSNRRTAGFTEATEFHGYQRIRKGQVAVHKMDGFAGAIGVSDSDGMCSPVLTLLDCASGLRPDYLALTLREISKTGWIEALAKGVRERTTEFGWSDLSWQVVPLPDIRQQEEIITYLDQETSQIDTLVEKTRRAIELLKERRQALITQVVTGKIDVRGFAGGNS